MTLVRGPIFQVCWVVDDIDASARWFEETLGVTRFARFSDVRFGPEDGTVRGAPADYVVHVAIGYAGEQQVELIEPVRGESLYTEHLARSGPGLHHVAYVPDDYDAALEAARARGLAVLQEGRMGRGLEFAYLDGAAGGAPYVELLRLSPKMRAFFASLASGGAQGEGA